MTRLALASLLTALVAVPAVGQSADAGIRTVTVFIKSSDLSASGTPAQLDRNIVDAVRHLCGDLPVDEMVDCRRTARAQIDAKIAEIRAAGTFRMSSR